MAKYSIQNNIMFIVLLLLATVSVTIVYSFSSKTIFLEDYLYGFRLFPINKLKNKHIVLVLIDGDTVRKYGQTKLKRSEYAKAIDYILKGKPKLIGIDIFFDGVKDSKDDMKLVESLDKANAGIVLAVYPLEIDNLVTNRIESLSTMSFSFKNISMGDVEIFKYVDGRIKQSSAVPTMDQHNREYLPFPIIIISKYLGVGYKQKPLLDKGTLVATLGDIEIPDPSNMTINYIGGIEAFDTVSFAKVTETEPAFFQNKIVLIGASAESLGDSFVTPISDKTPGVVVHANTIDTIINKRFISEMQFSHQIIIAFIICVVIAWMTFYIRPVFSCAMIILLLIALKIFTDLLFRNYSFYIPLAPLLLSLLLTYCFALILKMKIKGIYSKANQQASTQ